MIVCLSTPSVSIGIATSPQPQTCFRYPMTSHYHLLPCRHQAPVHFEFNSHDFVSNWAGIPSSSWTETNTHTLHSTPQRQPRHSQASKVLGGRIQVGMIQIHQSGFLLLRQLQESCQASKPVVSRPYQQRLFLQNLSETRQLETKYWHHPWVFWD